MSTRAFVQVGPDILVVNCTVPGCDSCGPDLELVGQVLNVGGGRERSRAAASTWPAPAPALGSDS